MKDKSVAKSVVEADWDIVGMVSVPQPPASRRDGKYLALYVAIEALPPDESLAIKVPCSGPKQLNYMRTQLRVKAKLRGRKVLSSRNEDSTLAWFWLAPKEGEGK